MKKITGKIVLIETEGRKDAWVRKQLPRDYFLALEIIQIDDNPITTCASAFDVLKPQLPEMRVHGEDVREIFKIATLPPGSKDVLHISLGYFPDFRIGRSVANEIDLDKVAAAEDMAGELLSFEMEGNPFEVVTTSEFYNHLITDAFVAKANSLGGKDGIINLKPSSETQKILTQKSQEVFGKDFVLWNGQQQPVPYHVTFAQTNQLSLKLQKAHEQTITPESDESLSLSAMV